MRVDAARIRQALMILLDNAKRYGGDEIHMILETTPSGYRIAVEDNGPGMSDADKEVAFERFFRGSNSAERYDSGLGLGLPIAKGIVEAHGGTVQLEDSPLGGLCAVVHLDGPRRIGRLPKSVKRSKSKARRKTIDSVFRSKGFDLRAP